MRFISTAAHGLAEYSVGFIVVGFPFYYGLTGASRATFETTPDAVVDRIAQATRMAMADPTLLDSYRSQAMEPDSGSGPEMFQQLVKDELLRLAPVIKSTGFKVD